MKVSTNKRKAQKVWWEFISQTDPNPLLTAHFWRRWKKRFPEESYQRLSAKQIKERILTAKAKVLFTKWDPTPKEGLLVQNGRILFAIYLADGAVATVFPYSRKKIKQYRRNRKSPPKMQGNHPPQNRSREVKLIQELLSEI